VDSSLSVLVLSPKRGPSNPKEKIQKALQTQKKRFKRPFKPKRKDSNLSLLHACTYTSLGGCC